MNTYYRGLVSECYAKIFLRMHGYTIMCSRYITGKYTGRAEIDIIAKRGNVLVFVEVKQRKNLMTAWDAITAKQIQRLRRAADSYIIKHKWCGDARFDVIAVCGLKIHWIKNAM